tara:strand:+ start:386 stop:829 length:444 start_codon:yes stop_codon:yes gene_type:complete
MNPHEGKIIGLCHGCFDVIHVGHIIHLKEAKSICDILFVSVTSDKFVSKRKGSNRPVFSLDERVEVLSSIKYVDFVIPCDAETALPSIDSIRPDFYIKGFEYSESVDSDKNLMKEINAVNKFGGDIRFVGKDYGWSSTKVLYFMSGQ